MNAQITGRLRVTQRRRYRARKSSILSQWASALLLFVEILILCAFCEEFENFGALTMKTSFLSLIEICDTFEKIPVNFPAPGASNELLLIENAMFCEEFEHLTT